MSAAAVRPADAALYGGFLLNGVVSVLLGPVIPELRFAWGVTPATAASLFVAQFAFSALGAVVASFDVRRSLVCGYGAIAVGLTILATGEWSLARLAMAAVGLGLGLTIPATNLAVAHRNPLRRGAALATLNLTWGAGAMACPLVFAALRGRLPATAALWGLAAAAVVASAAAAWAVRSASPPPAAEPAVAPRFGFLLLVAAMLFLYVGSESTMGGWLVELADQLGGERTAVSMLVGWSFWGAILAGRASASVLLARVSEPALYKASLALAGAGTLTVLLADSRTGVAAGALAAGAGMAPLFPLTISLLTARTASTLSRGTGWVFACGGVGGAVLPWLAGQVTDGDAGLSRGFAVPLAGMALLAVLYALHRFTAREDGEEPLTS
jgi:fucose permease